MNSRFRVALGLMKLDLVGFTFELRAGDVLLRVREHHLSDRGPPQSPFVLQFAGYTAFIHASDGRGISSLSKSRHPMGTHPEYHRRT